MTLEAPPSPRPIPAYAGAIACICLVAACGVAMAGAFAYLDRSSLWLDELCTVFFQQGNVYDVFEKTIHFDVHPPLYMELLGLWRSVFGSSPTSLRLPSAIAAAGAAPALYFAARPVLSRWAALLLAALCVTSIFWFDQAQQARPYTLALLGTAFLLGGLVRAVTAANARDADRAAIWIAGSAFVVSFLHFYAFIMAGLVILISIVLLRKYRAAFILFVVGAVIFGLMVAFVLIRKSQNEITSQGLWFNDSWRAKSTYTEFIQFIIGSVEGLLVIVLACAAALFGLLRDKTSPVGAIVASPLLRTAVISAAIPVAVFLVAVALVVAGVPTLSSRNLALAAPFIWLSVAAIADWGGARLPVRLQAAQQVVSAILLLLAAGLAIHNRLVQHREDWRGAAEAIAAYPGCSHAAVDVISPSRLPVMKGITSHLYGYYAPALSFSVLDANAPDTTAVLADRTRRIVQGKEPCKVVLWGAHSLQESDVAAIRNGIAARLGAGGANQIHVVWFPHWQTGVLARPLYMKDVFLIVADPARTAG